MPAGTLAGIALDVWTYCSKLARQQHDSSNPRARQLSQEDLTLYGTDFR